MKRNAIVAAGVFLIICSISFAGKCAYSVLPAEPANPRIFVSAATTTGAMGGIIGADKICNDDINKPTTRTYKAMIWSSTRNIYSNWVLKPNTYYYQTDGTTVIGKTDQYAKLIFPLAQPIGASIVIYSGVSTAGDYADSSYTCSNWNSTAGMSAIGNASYSTFSALRVNSVGCNTPYQVYCVEQ